jgi:hypothetical protein
VLDMIGAIDRVVGGVFGFAVGAMVGCVVPAWFGWGIDPVLSTFGGGLLGAVIGAVSPPHAGRPQLRELPRAETGAPVPVGALGAEHARSLDRPTARALLIGITIALGALPAALLVHALTGTSPSIPVLGLIAALGFVACIAAISFLPVFMLPKTTRTAMAAELWLGAREYQRVFGSRQPIDGFPVTPDEVQPWLAARPETEASLEGRVELMLMAGDWEAARSALDRMPERTAPDRYRRALLESVLRYQMSGEVDDSSARSAADAIPPGPDRTEAAVGLAAFGARRRLPDRDWRQPLLEVREQIPETDAGILLRDLGWVTLLMMLRKTWLVPVLIVAVVIFVTVLSVIVGPPPG